MIFRVIPEYTTRLTALKSGETDVIMASGGVSPKDADELTKNSKTVGVKSVRNRLFDSIVWLNIDGESYQKDSSIIPNFFFGDKRVRQAMTFAINRQAIVDGFMGNNLATVVNTSLSPGYTSLKHPSLHNYDFNPDLAKKLLTETGWKLGSSGLLEKNGRKFSFTLTCPIGNARRNYAATIVQQNLRDIGIECKLEYAESIIISKGQNEYHYNAVLSGLSAETLPFQLIIWNSDFTKSLFNSCAFQSKSLDSTIAILNVPQSKEVELKAWYRFQEIIHDEQPRTFLYYFDELEGFNNRIENAKPSMLAVLINAYDWTISEK
jgi:peptide/nickel transport system substrate-binding protein